MGCVRIVVVPILVVEILWGYHLESRINNDEEGTCIVLYDAPAEEATINATPPRYAGPTRKKNGKK